MKFSSLHRKGVSTLCLLVIAESVTFSNAVKIQDWIQNKYREGGGGGGRGENTFIPKENDTCDDPPAMATATGLCPVPAPTFSKARSHIVKRLSRKKIRKFAEDCCMECSNCMPQDDFVKQCTDIPRGGYVHNHDHGHSSAGGVAPYGIPLPLWKVIFQFFLTSLNVLCWLIPLRSKRVSENKLGLSLANAFSGGVFLSLAFGHLIPECTHGFAGFNEATPYLLVLAGYLVIFFVEKVAFDAHDILHEMEHSNDHKGSAKTVEKENGVGASTEGGFTGGRSAVILLAALAVHSILEMAALGLADSFGDSALLTLSIALHQPAESIALLVAFLKSGMPKGQILQFLSAFSAMGPIGVALGMAVNEFASPLIDSAMLAVVAGTFVYVGATEVIPEEWEDSEHKWKKFTALMGGIVSIILITQYTMSLGV